MFTTIVRPGGPDAVALTILELYRTATTFTVTVQGVGVALGVGVGGSVGQTPGAFDTPGIVAPAVNCVETPFTSPNRKSCRYVTSTRYELAVEVELIAIIREVGTT